MSAERSSVLCMLESRLVHARKMAENADRYVGLVAEIIQGVDPDEYALIVKSINFAKTVSLSADNSSMLAEITRAYDILGDLDIELARLQRMFENAKWAKLAIYNKSTTYTLDIHRCRSSADDAHRKYLDVDDEPIFDAVKLAVGEPPLAFVLENENAVDDTGPTRINKFTIWLISWTLSTARGEARRRLERMVERCKDAVMGSMRIPLGYAGAAGAFCHTRAVTSSMPPDALWKQLGREWDDSLTFDENCARSHGLIVMTNPTGSPVEFDLRGLIDSATIAEHDFQTHPTSGLTKRILERFNTAKLLPSDKNVRAKPFSRFPQTGQVPSWQIIESIDGTTWRIVVPIGVDPADDFSIPADLMRAFTEGVSTRPHQYSVMQKITSRCFDPRAPHKLRDYAATISSRTSTEVLRAKIVDALSRGFEGRLGSAPSGQKLSPRAFRDLAVDVVDVSETLLDMLSERVADASPESICTYAAKTDGVVRSLVSEINRALDIHSPPPRFYAETRPTELLAGLLGIFRTCVAAAVDELERSGAWEEYDLTLKEFW